MLTFTPHLAMLASLLAVTILPASTIAAAAAEAKGFNPLNSISGNRLGGLRGKRQMFERDVIDEPFGVPGRIDIQSSATSLFLNISTLALDESYTDETHLIMAPSAAIVMSSPIHATPPKAALVSLHVADFPTFGNLNCVTAGLDTAHPFKVERCADSK